MERNMYRVRVAMYGKWAGYAENGGPYVDLLIWAIREPHACSCARAMFPGLQVVSCSRIPDGDIPKSATTRMAARGDEG